MSAEIIQFVPRPNPKREALSVDQQMTQYQGAADAFHATLPTDCGNAIWPWPEKDGV